MCLFVSLVDILCFEALINWDHMRFLQEEMMFLELLMVYTERIR